MSDLSKGILIVPLSPDLKGQAASLFARAYERDPAVLSLTQDINDSTRLRLLTFYWKLQIAYCLAYGHPIALLKDGHLVGAQLLYLPGQYPIPACAQWVSLIKTVVYFLISGMGIASLRRLMAITAKLGEFHPSEPHVYTELACIAPEFQGQSLYTPLQQYLFDLADQCGVGVYGETSNPNNVPRLVKRFGFQVLHEIKVGEATYWSLWRPEPKNLL